MSQPDLTPEQQSEQIFHQCSHEDRGCFNCALKAALPILRAVEQETWAAAVKYHRTQCRYQGCRESRQHFDCEEVKEYGRRATGGTDV